MKLEIPEVKVSEEDLKLRLASSLFEDEIISLGKAAEISGYSERSFSEILRKKGIAPIRYENIDLDEEKELVKSDR